MTPPRPESTAVIAARRAGLTRRDLHTGWTVRATAGPVPSHILNETIPAEVPGVVHLDLLRAALIPDPYVDDNEALLNWIGQTDWTYQTTFTVDADHLAPGQRHELIFDGLDTVASISFDGEPLGEVANQHRTYRFDVTDRLAAGEHTLTVAFRSPVKYANAQSLLLGARPRPYPDPYEAIRKSACSFGWDWGIATATSGIWRAVRLETWSMARLSEVRVQAAPDAAGNGGTVTAEVEVEHARDAPSPLELIIEVAGVEARVVVDPGASRATATVKLPAVELWWPAGHGDQPLYAATITLAVPGEHEGIGEPLDSATRRVGFRTLEWDTAKDEHGTRSSSSSTAGRSLSKASTGSLTTHSSREWTAAATFAA
ncbi:glycosyl hydrolase 2 galactose-binding domain-containing protein [Arthrobacter sp. SD76]|uniref:glycosyl hydrolase 2 galactose-binding domain-containing protein n=1 Tax=Arthrobacter sp. SD76 TaxID=3415007 RepID=UPI003C733321